MFCSWTILKNVYTYISRNSSNTLIEQGYHLYDRFILRVTVDWVKSEEKLENYIWKYSENPRGKISENSWKFILRDSWNAQSEKRFVLSGCKLVRNPDAPREETKMY